MNSVNSRGFTLLEILVAIAVFSILSYMSYGGLQKVLTSRDLIDQKSTELDELQFAFTIINNDLQQVVNRSVRGRLGDRQNAFERRPDSDIYLSFTTQIVSPWQITSQTSSLQRIDYRWQDNNLYRDVWPVLDRAHNTEPDSQLLLSDFNEFNIEFLYDKNYEFWPVPSADGEYPDIPTAVRLIVSLEKSFTINKVFLLGQS